MRKILLILAKYSGMFFLARFLTRRSVKIISYHAIAAYDLNIYNPTLFLTVDKLARRIACMKAKKYKFIYLNEAVSRLRAGTIEPNSVVITIDDGWQSFQDIAWPMFRQADMPVSLYVYTEAVESGEPNFNVALCYLLWHAELKGLGEVTFLDGLGEEISFAATDMRAQDDLMDHAATLQPPDRTDILDAIAENAGLSSLWAERRDAFVFSSPDDLRKMAADGLDIQLHTHTHKFGGLSEAESKSEISQNIDRLSAWLPGKKFTHFCYPSGDYEAPQLPWLADMGVKSATTCEAGLNNPGVNPFLLRRFLDADTVSDIEFEAEVTGFLPWLRCLRRG